MGIAISVSVKNVDKWIIEAVEARAARWEDGIGTVSGQIMHILGRALNEGLKPERPYWYVPGRDYSHLNPQTREMLKQFGYDEEAIKAQAAAEVETREQAIAKARKVLDEKL